MSCAESEVNIFFTKDQLDLYCLLSESAWVSKGGNNVGVGIKPK